MSRRGRWLTCSAFSKRHVKSVGSAAWARRESGLSLKTLSSPAAQEAIEGARRRRIVVLGIEGTLGRRRWGSAGSVVDDEQLELLLVDRPRRIGEEHTRMVCQLYQLLLELILGGVKRDLSAAQAGRLLAGVRPPRCCRHERGTLLGIATHQYVDGRIRRMSFGSTGAPCGMADSDLTRASRSRGC